MPRKLLAPSTFALLLTVQAVLAPVAGAGTEDLVAEPVFQLRVLDTKTGDERVYSRPLGQSYEAVRDTSAFPTCP